MSEKQLDWTLKGEYYLMGFGYNHIELIEDNERLNGVNIFMFGKLVLTIAYAEKDWTDDEGVPIKFKIENKRLFAKRLAIGLGGNKSTV